MQHSDELNKFMTAFMRLNGVKLTEKEVTSLKAVASNFKIGNPLKVCYRQMVCECRVSAYCGDAFFMGVKKSSSYDINDFLKELSDSTLPVTDIITDIVVLRQQSIPSYDVHLMVSNRPQPFKYRVLAA